MTPEEYITRMTETSQKKYRLIDELSDLTKSQTDVITEDSISHLQELIDQKQVKIEAVQKLDEEFNVYFQRMKQTLKISSLDELKGKNIAGLKELQEIIGQIVAKTKQINELEKQNHSKAKKVLSHLGDEITKINQGKRMNAVYNPPPAGPPPSYFFDKKK